MFDVQNSTCIPRSLEAEKNEDRSTFNGRASWQKKKSNQKVSGLA